MEPRPQSRRVLTVPGWWSTVGEAETATARTVALVDLRSACTHALDGIAVATVELMPGVAAPWGAHASPPGRVGHLAELAHENRWSGRAFVFEGQSGLADEMRVGDLVDRTAIDAVVLPGGTVQLPLDRVVVDARGLRPVFRDGRLVLTVRPGPGGVLQPFERGPVIVTEPRRSGSVGPTG